ncbi:acyltransferase family protein [Longivirga aurantiaca]|uniref:Acyltransferase n=1 Tax=Longivirga aurantiaca TaxID=1837743 RepID=A0ABW1SWM5_9ACTN
MRVFPPLPPVPPAPDPGTRDLALDVVRAWSLLVVVLGHFLMLILLWDDDGVPASANTLTSGAPWPYVTWLLQVMPLFFIAGGAVNQRSFERFAGSYNQWLWNRTRRLMRPTVVFLLALAVIFTVVTLLVRREVTDPLLQGVTGPLWFLALYIPVTALTPVTSRWWARSGPWSVGVLLVGVAAVDYVRLSHVETWGALNMLLAWVLVHQLGYWYRAGVSRRMATALLLGGLAVNVWLSQVLGWYPTSLVGIPTEKFSNMAPPTIVLVMHSFVLFGGFVLLAPWLRVRFATPRAFAATTRAALFAMTIYLWHMLVLVGWLSLLHALDLDLPVRVEGGNIVPEGLNYWGWLVPSTIGFALVLYAVVRWLWPVEFLRLPWFDGATGRPSDSAWRAGIGATLVGAGLLAVAGAGFSGFPVAVHTAYGIPVSSAGAMVAIGVGLALLRQPAPARAEVGAG